MSNVFEKIPEVLFIDNVLYMVANHEMIKTVVGTRYPWGVPISRTNIALSSCTTGGSMAKGRYRLCAVPENMLGNIGNPYKTDANFIPLTVYTAAHTSSADSVKIIVTVPKHPDAQVENWLFYRTRVDEDGPYFYAGECTNGTSSFTFTEADDSLATNEFLEGPYSDDDSTLAGPFVYGRPPVHSFIINAFGDTVFAFGAKPYTQGLATATVGSTTVTFGESAVTSDATDSGFNVSYLIRYEDPNVTHRFIGHRFKFDDSNFAYTINAVPNKNTITLNTPFLAPNGEADGTTIVGAFTITGDQNMVCPSRPGEPEYFCPAEQFEVGQNTGTTLRGGITWAGDVLLFTEKTIYRVTQGGNPGTYQVYETMSAYGTVAHRSVCQTPRGIAFFTGDHIAIYNNQVSTIISDPLGDLLKNSNPYLKEWVVCKMVDNRLYVAFAAADEAYLDSIAVFDMDTGVWDYWDGLQIVTMQSITSKKGQNRLYIECPVGNDGYAAYYFTPSAFNDGFGNVDLSGVVAASTEDTLTTTTVFPTYAGNGWDLRGMRVKIRTGTAAGEMRRIIANTANTITVGVPWTTQPAVDDTYTIGQIETYVRTGRQSFPDPQTEHQMKDAEIRIAYIPVG